MRPAVRLASLIGVPATYVWTHDSIWLGEDGPTHQPVEHLMALRAIPNLYMLRPCDANEVAQAWRVAVERRDGPCGFALSRQALPTLDRSRVRARRGRAARGLRPGRHGRRPGRHRHGDRRGGARRPGGARDPAGRRHRRAGRLDALLGALRPAGPGVPRRGAAAVGHRPRVDRGGNHLRVAALHRTGRARAWASTASAPRGRARWWRASSASRRTPSSPPCGR